MYTANQRNNERDVDGPANRLVSTKDVQNGEREVGIGVGMSVSYCKFSSKNVLIQGVSDSAAILVVLNCGSWAIPVVQWLGQVANIRRLSPCAAVAVLTPSPYDPLLHVSPVLSLPSFMSLPK